MRNLGSQAARALADAYCVVQGHDSWLHFVDPARPMRYRSGIALCVGAGERDIDIQAARPRPTDTEIQGFHCRSVLAVSIRNHSDPASRGYKILLDGRPILEGWSMLTVPHRSLSMQQLLEGLDTVAPHGWKIHLNTLPDSHGHLHLVAGQVLVVLVIEYTRKLGTVPKFPDRAASHSHSLLGMLMDQLGPLLTCSQGPMHGGLSSTMLVDLGLILP